MPETLVNHGKRKRYAVLHSGNHHPRRQKSSGQKQLGFQGKAIGDVLKAVYEWVLEEPSRNEKDILERYIETEFLTRL